MKAAVYRQYGPPEVFQVEEVAKPIPKDNEILLRVRATAVNSGDWRLRKADPFAVRFFWGLTKPKTQILGGVFSGEVESVGKDVRKLKAGDQIFGSTDMKFGAYAEYLCVPENGVFASKPDQLSHLEAAVIPFGGTTALDFIQKANIQPGQKVLIYGASGAVGTAAVQLAKHFGATVTGVCSTANVDLVKSLGTDHVIDYVQKDFTENSELYDVIFVTVRKISFSKSLKSLKKNGILILGAANVREMLQAFWVTKTSSKKVITGMIHQDAESMAFLKNLIVNGELKPVIDSTYTLDQIREAHAYAEQGHKKGNVAILV